MGEIYFRQLLAGRDFARVNPIAVRMVNFIYLIGDQETKECLVVDPAWDVEGLLQAAEQDGMKLVGALATHYHPDHVGGSLFGYDVEGLAKLLARAPVKVHVQKEEADGLRRVTGLSESDLERRESGDRIQIGSVQVECIHTPGHTPGSQCFLVNGSLLVSGDTLFIQGCGRVDLPGGNPQQMYESLTQKLAKLPDHILLYPGHDYADKPVTTLGEQKKNNYYLRMQSLDQWLRLMG